MLGEPDIDQNWSLHNAMSLKHLSVCANSDIAMSEGHMNASTSACERELSHWSKGHKRITQCVCANANPDIDQNTSPSERRPDSVAPGLKIQQLARDLVDYSWLELKSKVKYVLGKLSFTF